MRFSIETDRQKPIFALDALTSNVVVVVVIYQYRYGAHYIQTGCTAPKRTSQGHNTEFHKPRARVTSLGVSKLILRLYIIRIYKKKTLTHIRVRAIII